jgi:hypothetical protein
VISSGRQLTHSSSAADQSKSRPVATQLPLPNDGPPLARPSSLVLSGMTIVAFSGISRS